MSRVWDWLSKKKTQATLLFIGPGLVFVWHEYIHFPEHTPSPQMVVSAPNGIAVGGGTVTNPTVNNNYASSVPPPSITWSSAHTDPLPNPGPFSDTLWKYPGSKVEITLQGILYYPLFVVQCNRPCGAITIGVEGVSSPKLYGTNNPNFTIAGFSMPSELDQGSKVSIDVRSKDENNIEILSVQPYVQHQ